MKLFVTRHGQTEWNIENKVCGFSDVNLSEKGLKQASQLAVQFAEHKIDLIISSPLVRAFTTAEIISREVMAGVVIDDRLMEQNYGVFEGVNRKEANFLHAKKQFANKMGGGESLFQVAQRVYNFIDEIQMKHKDRNVLLVTHGSICRVIHAYYNDLSNEEYFDLYTANCEYRLYE